jgi:hypothetical protein
MDDQTTGSAATAGTEPPGPPPAIEPPRAAAGPRDDGESHRGVALLLGAVAIVAALVGARATALSSDAGDAWQSALRTEVKRSAGALHDISYLYQVEVPPVFTIIGGRMQEAELRSAAANTGGEAARVLTMEADVQAGLVKAIEGSYKLATNDAYALPSGGVDIGLRLADLRNQAPDMVALDPDVIQATGDALGTKGSSMTIALMPLGFAALFGALAEPFRRRRRALLVLGTAASGLGLIIAGVVEVLG